jgi:hypothetical protein
LEAGATSFLRWVALVRRGSIGYAKCVEKAQGNQLLYRLVKDTIAEKYANVVPEALHFHVRIIGSWRVDAQFPYHGDVDTSDLALSIRE